MQHLDIDVYNQKDIIQELNFDSPVEEDVMKTIITSFYKEAGEAIAQNKVVSVPYIGNIRKSLVQQEFSKTKYLFKIARRYKTLDEYKEYVKEKFIESKEIAENKDRFNHILRENRRLNRKTYEKLIVTCGKAYADMFIFSISCFNVIDFNPDVEDAYQEIWRLENET